MVTIENNEKFTNASDAENPFVDKTVVVTGKLMSFTRSSINAKIEELGARAGSSVTTSTDFLICGESAGGKLSKAKSLGIKVLSEEQFLEMAMSA